MLVSMSLATLRKMEQQPAMQELAQRNNERIEKIKQEMGDLYVLAKNIKLVKIKPRYLA